jgi:hypothetical protein
MSEFPHPMLLISTSKEELVEEIMEAILERLPKVEFTPHSNDLLTPRQVEEMLDISHQTRIDWTKQGILKSYSFGGRKKYYKRSDIMDSLIKIEK